MPSLHPLNNSSVVPDETLKSLFIAIILILTLLTYNSSVRSSFWLNLFYCCKCKCKRTTATAAIPPKYTLKLNGSDVSCNKNQIIWNSSLHTSLVCKSNPYMVLWQREEKSEVIIFTSLSCCETSGILNWPRWHAINIQVKSAAF